MAREISDVTFLKMLTDKVASLGGPAAAGREWGEHSQLITNAISGARYPSPKMLRGMGYREIKAIGRTYVRCDAPKKDSLTGKRKEK